MSVNFRDLLSKPSNEVKKPKPLPPGTYRVLIMNKAFDVSKNKGTPFVRLTLKPLSAEADVDVDMLDGVDLTSKTLRIDFYLTDDAMFRVVDLAKSLNIETEGRSVGEIIDDFPNNTALAAVTQTINGDETYNNVTKLTAE